MVELALRLAELVARLVNALVETVKEQRLLRAEISLMRKEQQELKEAFMALADELRAANAEVLREVSETAELVGQLEQKIIDLTEQIGDDAELQQAAQEAVTQAHEIRDRLDALQNKPPVPPSPPPVEPPVEPQRNIR